MRSIEFPFLLREVSRTAVVWIFVMLIWPVIGFEKVREQINLGENPRNQRFLEQRLGEEDSFQLRNQRSLKQQMSLGREDSFQPLFQSNFRGNEQDNSRPYVKGIQQQAYRTSFEHVDSSNILNNKNVLMKYNDVIEDYSEYINGNYKDFITEEAADTNYKRHSKTDFTINGRKSQFPPRQKSKSRQSSRNANDLADPATIGLYKQETDLEGDPARINGFESPIDINKPVNGLENSEYTLFYFYSIWS